MRRLTFLVAAAALGGATTLSAQAIPLPDAAYLAATTLLPIVGPDGTPLGSVSSGPFTVSFADAANNPLAIHARTQPGGGWGTWSVAPFSEKPDNATPIRVLSDYSSSFVRFLSNVPVTIMGLEAEPDPFSIHTITADFYRGGVLVGSVSQAVEGDAGARLFAFQDLAGIDRLDLSSDRAFGVAFVRVGSTVSAVPEPATVALLATGLAGVGVLARRRGRARA